MARTRVQRSAGSVFRDLFGPEEAASLKIRADLMIEIERLLKRRRLRQAAAAKLLGVTQPRVSDLVRGKIELFSIDTLVDMLTRAGVSVRVNVRLIARKGEGRRSRLTLAVSRAVFRRRLQRLDSHSGQRLVGRAPATCWSARGMRWLELPPHRL